MLLRFNVNSETNAVYKLLDGKKRRLGHIEGDVFKTIRTPKHYFIKYNGFGLSQGLIKLLLKNKVEKVRITYEGITCSVYRVDLVKFLDEKVRFEYNDNGDLQYILPLKEMKEYKR